MLLRRTWTLRRRGCTAPLLLIGVAVCLLYQMLVVDRSGFKSSGGGPTPHHKNRSLMSPLEHRRLLQDPEKLVSALDAFQVDKVVSSLYNTPYSLHQLDDILC